MIGWHKIATRVAAGCVCVGMVLAGLLLADLAFPPPLDEADIASVEVLDADGLLLRAFTMKEGRWRLRTRIEDVDPQLIRMVISYEDQRFWHHPGIDPLALGRALMQLVAHGHIVSGGSTLSMQVARLIEPREGRSVPAKLRQIARALQIERRLSKRQILELYLTRAPYGGNLEGVRAASLAYFGKEPRHLTLAQTALLVALPQMPEKRRPDLHPAEALAARQRVLERGAVGVDAEDVAQARLVALPDRRLNLPAFAPHLAEAALRKAPEAWQHRTSLRRRIQQGLEAVARDAAARIGAKLSLAMVMADVHSGDIVAEVGSADYFDAVRSGWIDMTRVPRSPGSALKPFIYGLAFEEGLIAQETLIEDRPADFFGYRPRNFDLSYQGDVSIRQALQLSLNVPAMRLLDALGPVRLLVRFRRAGVRLALPAHEAPGLAIGLGGVGITLMDLVQLYAGLVDRERLMRLGDRIHGQPERIEGAPLLEPAAAWNVADILSGVLPPVGAAPRRIAYKTGTSYGYRDAWSIGFDGRYVLGVWVGRPDNGAVPGLTGYGTAAPILFEAFTRSGVAATPLPPAPVGVGRLALTNLPISQRRFASTADGLPSLFVAEPPPQIVYPPEGAHVDLGAEPDGMPLVLKLQGGLAPFRWLANGKPLPELSRGRTSQWVPDGDGFSILMVIDAVGRTASVSLYIDR
ncbi:penicillin-binding protein 1C [Beijerinckia indica]|uniref:peptidoglycan glycosyltransferase n=1 Tax=Beijerinckia indica subsp. indica (strain ATCC 9039 / DSM 1715 / NCIMB 8712) TaxID=395963 RepID=B2IFP5_BEII9|nr:penicillin-binding protein 1C [Beijerinckia indica]ACB94256.1 penicillin-binding protein 1C [Beijerinckia indica subsp. indica ATCC 9039]